MNIIIKKILGSRGSFDLSSCDVDFKNLVTPKCQKFAFTDLHGFSALVTWQLGSQDGYFDITFYYLLPL